MPKLLAYENTPTTLWLVAGVSQCLTSVGPIAPLCSFLEQSRERSSTAGDEDRTGCGPRGSVDAVRIFEGLRICRGAGPAVNARPQQAPRTLGFILMFIFHCR